MYDYYKYVISITTLLLPFTVMYFYTNVIRYLVQILLASKTV